MKRKYIKPTTSVVRVETQNNYCAASLGAYATPAEQYSQTPTGVMSSRTRRKVQALTILGTATSGSPCGIRPSETTTYET